MRSWLAAAAMCVGTLMGARIGALSILLLGLGACGAAARRRPIFSAVALMLIAAGAGALNVQLRPHRDILEEVARDVPRCRLSLTVLEHLGGLGTLMSVDEARCDTISLRAAGTAISPDNLGEAGVLLQGVGWLIPLRDESFDVARRHAGSDVVVQLQHHEIAAAPRGMHAVAARVREGLRQATSTLPPRSGALLRGLAIGDTADIDPATIDNFRASGLSHILAVSGSNVAIVLAAVAIGLKGIGHHARIGAAYVALGLFILIVGPDASVLRAGVMGAISLACLATGRRSEPLAALALAVIAIVALRPGMLFAVGLHLSVAAAAGIIVFAHAIGSRLRFLPGPLRVLLAATLAAQVAVAPLLVLTFGELSLSAPLANILALPAVGPLTVVGLGAGVLEIVAGPVAGVIVKALGPALSWVTFIAGRLGTPEWASVGVPRWLGWIGFVLVFILGIAVMREPAPGPARALDRVAT